MSTPQHFSSVGVGDKIVSGQTVQLYVVADLCESSVPPDCCCCRTSWWTWPRRWPTPRPCWCWRPRTWPRSPRTLCYRTGSSLPPPSAPCPPPSWWRAPRYKNMFVGHSKNIHDRYRARNNRVIVLNDSHHVRVCVKFLHFTPPKKEKKSVDIM